MINSSDGKAVSLLKLLVSCPEFLLGEIVKEEATNRKGLADETVPLNVVSVRMGQKNVVQLLYSFLPKITGHQTFSYKWIVPIRRKEESSRIDQCVCSVGIAKMNTLSLTHVQHGDHQLLLGVSRRLGCD